MKTRNLKNVCVVIKAGQMSTKYVNKNETKHKRTQHNVKKLVY